MNNERMSFQSFLWVFYGISWNYYENNYAGLQARQIEDEYDYYLDHPEEYDGSSDYLKEAEGV